MIAVDELHRHLTKTVDLLLLAGYCFVEVLILKYLLLIVDAIKLPIIHLFDERFDVVRRVVLCKEGFACRHLEVLVIYITSLYHHNSPKCLLARTRARTTAIHDVVIVILSTQLGCYDMN